MTQHTPGTAKVIPPNADNPSRAMVAVNGVTLYNAPLTGETEANAARIAACWNACAGIYPNVVPALIKDIQGMMQALALNRPEEELLKDYGMLGIHNIRAVKDSLAAIEKTWP